jgi:hypothetical protein
LQLIYLFISQNKKLFQLSDTCKLEALAESPNCLEEAIHYIDTHPSIHRVLSANKDHYFTFRKDLAGQWRVIDSWAIYHNASEQDPLKRLQPAFPTFRIAFEAHFTRLGDSNGWRNLIYPTEDMIPLFPSTSTSAPPDIAPPQTIPTKGKQSWPAQLWSGLVACFTRLLDCICACFCQRRG